MFIKEYRIEGSHVLPRIEVEAAVYRFLGPGRTRDDVEKARAALEKAYQDKGFQTVSVEVPKQEIRHGIIRLRVVERTVGRLRVKGAVYSSPRAIKAMAPSVAEGSVIDFNKVTPDVVALNQLPDRRVTPALHEGSAPDTVDVDLNVKESQPVHASIELNNRQAPETDPLRVNASISDNNLWQAGHSASVTYQVSPQDPKQVQVISAYYLARFRGVDWLSLMLQGTKQNSNVSTLGDVAVAGRGETLGLNGIIALPTTEDFTDSVTLGLTYKNFNQNLNLGSTGGIEKTPIKYFPLSATYSATWIGKGSTTQGSLSLNTNLRSVAGNQANFENSRYNADGGYVYLHGDLSRTQELPLGLQIFGKVQGQLSDEPLISSEEASGGGLGTVRGYLEAETVGDNAGFASVELRSPSLVRFLHVKKGDFRVFGFYDAGLVTLRDPLPDQKSKFYLASYGAGSRLQLLDHFDGAVDVSVPQYNQADTKAGDVRVTFRAELDY